MIMTFGRGAEHPAWKGGRYLSSSGHWYVLLPNGQYVLEHRLVAQNRIGRPLNGGEVVHHKNNNKLDNRPSNLAVTHRDAHAAYHWSIGTIQHAGRPPANKKR